MARGTKKRDKVNARWEEILRIASARQRVTMVAEQENGRILKVRRSTAPEEKLAAIQQALGVPALPRCSIESVWLQNQDPENEPHYKSTGWQVNLGQCGFKRLVAPGPDDETVLMFFDLKELE